MGDNLNFLMGGDALNFQLDGMGATNHYEVGCGQGRCGGDSV